MSINKTFRNLFSAVAFIHEELHPQISEFLSPKDLYDHLTDTFYKLRGNEKDTVRVGDLIISAPNFPTRADWTVASIDVESDATEGDEEGPLLEEKVIDTEEDDVKIVQLRPKVIRLYRSEGQRKAGHLFRSWGELHAYLRDFCGNQTPTINVMRRRARLNEGTRTNVPNTRFFMEVDYK